MKREINTKHLKFIYSCTYTDTHTLHQLTKIKTYNMFFKVENLKQMFLNLS